MSEDKKMTRSLEDYLEAMYNLGKCGKEIRLTDVSTSLKVAKPSVNKAISVLKEQGYIKQEKYGRLYFTEKGMEVASKVINRHDTIYAFLAGTLGVKENIAEEEACLIEHCMSDDTVKKLKDFLKEQNKLKGE